MSDVSGRVYGQSTRGGRKASRETSELQERMALELMDPELVPEPTLRQITLALGTESREDSAALCRADVQAAKLVSKILRTGPEPGEESTVPPISSTRPAAPATPPKGGRANLKF